MQAYHVQLAELSTPWILVCHTVSQRPVIDIASLDFSASWGLSFPAIFSRRSIWAYLRLLNAKVSVHTFRQCVHPCSPAANLLSFLHPLLGQLLLTGRLSLNTPHALGTL